MTREEAFLYNDFVASQLQYEKTISYKDFFKSTVFQELIEIAKQHISLPSVLPTGDTPFWFRKGNIHLHPRIQEISKQYIEPLLEKKDAFLIGDTAFCINHPPHDIHIDNRDFRTNLQNKKGIIGYKTVVIPLEIDTDDYPFLFTSNQYFYGPTTRFRKGFEDIDSKFENILLQKNNGVYFSYDYAKDGVQFLSNENLSREWYDRYIDYDLQKPWGVPFSSFEGLSIEKENVWKPNNVIAFDSSRIHFGELISKRSATYKLGISLNYGIKVVDIPKNLM